MLLIDIPDANTPDSQLEGTVGAVDSQTTEAFSVVANETRLSILLALWEAYDPFAEESAMPKSELRDQVGSPETEQFSDHLDTLTGHFVRNTDEGYKLSGAGHQVVRTVIAGTGIGGGPNA